MSKRRQPGEIVRRAPGSCFVGSHEPQWVRLTDERDGDMHYVDGGCCFCDDPDCCEWANVQIVTGSHVGEWMCHLAECQMDDGPEVTP